MARNLFFPSVCYFNSQTTLITSVSINAYEKVWWTWKVTDENRCISVISALQIVCMRKEINDNMTSIQCPSLLLFLVDLLEVLSYFYIAVLAKSSENIIPFGPLTIYSNQGENIEVNKWMVQPINFKLRCKLCTVAPPCMLRGPSNQTRFHGRLFNDRASLVQDR